MVRFPQIIGLALIVDIILFDQLSKWWITEMILRPQTGADSVGLSQWIMDAPSRVMSGATILVIPNFDLTMVWNEGVSFGLLQGAGIWPLVLLALAISAILSYWLVKTESKFEAMALGAIIGGAIGNVIDRFRFGAVADFFDVYVGTYHWPAFNIADGAITIGVVLLLIHGLFLDKKDKGEK